MKKFITALIGVIMSIFMAVTLVGCDFGGGKTGDDGKLTDAQKEQKFNEIVEDVTEQLFDANSFTVQAFLSGEGEVGGEKYDLFTLISQAIGDYDIDSVTLRAVFPEAKEGETQYAAGQFSVNFDGNESSDYTDIFMVFDGKYFGAISSTSENFGIVSIVDTIKRATDNYVDLDSEFALSVISYMAAFIEELGIEYTIPATHEYQYVIEDGNISVTHSVDYSEFINDVASAIVDNIDGNFLVFLDSMFEAFGIDLTTDAIFDSVYDMLTTTTLGELLTELEPMVQDLMDTEESIDSIVLDFIDRNMDISLTQAQLNGAKKMSLSDIIMIIWEQTDFDAFDDFDALWAVVTGIKDNENFTLANIIKEIIGDTGRKVPLFESSEIIDKEKEPIKEPISEGMTVDAVIEDIKMLASALTVNELGYSVGITVDSKGTLTQVLFETAADMDISVPEQSEAQSITAVAILELDFSDIGSTSLDFTSLKNFDSVDGLITQFKKDVENYGDVKK